jgi:hypothetical protein
MKTTPIAALACLVLAACDPESTDPEALELDDAEAIDDLSAEPEDGEEIDDAIEVSQRELARIELEHGEVVFFEDVDGPAAGELTMLEKAWPDDEGHLTLLPERSPLATFIALTSPDVPVPQAILASELDGAVLERASARLVVDQLEEPAHASIDRLAADIQPQAWWGPDMCNEGTTSAVFAAEICSLDWWWDTTVCHNGTWHSVTDYSANWAHWSRSRTLACITNGRARHLYRVGGVWYEAIDGSIPPNNVYVYTRSATNLLPRAITHSRTHSGFVRGSSHFRDF